MATAPGVRPAELPRPFPGVLVDHCTGADGSRVVLELDFVPLPPDAGKGFEFAADGLRAAPDALPPDAVRRFGGYLGFAWESERRGAADEGRPAYGARAVLRRAQRHGAGDAGSVDRVLNAAADLLADEVWDALAAGRMPRPVGRGALERPPALPRALPGLFVDHVMQTSCSGLFSVVWADAEPLPVDAAEDFDFVADLPATCRQPGTPLPREFAAAFGAGVRAMWERRGRGRPPFAARVVMRDAIWSEVDSSEHGFHAAGVIVAMEVLRCIADGREPRPVGRRSGRHRGAAPPMPRNRPPA